MSTQVLSSASTPQTEDDRQVVPRTNAEGPGESSEIPLPANGDDNSEEAVTMEERKAKMAQLRARMVSFSCFLNMLQRSL